MNKIPVSVLGATGAVGQRFVEMLVDHPYFEIVALTGSERSAGKTYGQACRWVLSGSIPEQVRDMLIQPTSTEIPGKVAFSALPAPIAREWEPELASKGYTVCSNASALRQTPGVPLLIPEINYDHLDMIPHQHSELGWKGLAVTSPNCTTNGIAMTLKPLDDAFGVEAVFVSTMQAISGAGYPGLASLDIQDNVVPFINGEEEKIQSGPGPGWTYGGFIAEIPPKTFGGRCNPRFGKFSRSGRGTTDADRTRKTHPGTSGC